MWCRGEKSAMWDHDEMRGAMVSSRPCGAVGSSRPCAWCRVESSAMWCRGGKAVWGELGHVVPWGSNWGCQVGAAVPGGASVKQTTWCCCGESTGGDDGVARMWPLCGRTQ